MRKKIAIVINEKLSLTCDAFMVIEIQGCDENLFLWWKFFRVLKIPHFINLHSCDVDSLLKWSHWPFRNHLVSILISVLAELGSAQPQLVQVFWHFSYLIHYYVWSTSCGVDGKIDQQTNSLVLSLAKIFGLTSYFWHTNHRKCS